MKVLIVDDDADTRETTAIVLTGAGFEVESAVDGRHALDKCQESLPDVIVLDMLLPVMDGYELARRLAGVVPIIAMTGGEPHDDPIPGLAAFIPKPADPDALVAAIRKAGEKP